MTHALRRAGATIAGALTLVTAALVGQPAAAAGADGSAPPAPTGVRVIDHDATSVELAWESTEPLDGYTTFYIYADGFLEYLTPATTARLCCLTPGETYDLTVTVKRPDTGLEEGRESAPSQSVTVRMDSDTTPPETPANLRLTGRQTQPERLGMYWTTARDDNGNVPSYEITGPTGTAVVDNYRTWHVQDVSGLDLRPGNEYAFEVRAIDRAGNRSVEPAVLRFETTPPGVATGLRQVSSRDGYPALIEWTAAPENAAIMGYEILLDGQSLGSTGTGAPRVDLFEQIFNVACVPPPSGPATVQVRAIDTSLNTGALSAPLTVVFP
jgi:hypothetical protein